MNLRISKVVLCLIVIAGLTGCQKDDTVNQPALEGSKDRKVSFSDAIKVSEDRLVPSLFNSLNEGACSHWDYSNTEWENYGCEKWSACGGQAQTPVNITGAIKNNNLKAIEFHWVNTKTTILNNGHTIQFNVDPGSYIVSGGKRYDLLQFHYHTTSEHEINGKSFPMEVHYVHQAADKTLAVVGVMFKRGPGNALFNRCLPFLPHSEGTYSDNEYIDLNSLLPEDRGYYNYNGSLTTPPCSEVVNWHLLKGTVTVSPQQLNVLESIMHHNNRPLQALNGRVISEFVAAK